MKNYRFPLETFEAQFSNNMLNRAKKIFTAGDFIAMISNRNGGVLKFTVQDNEEYLVTLQIEDEWLQRFHCTCAAGDNLCRHIAACLYELRKDHETYALPKLPKTRKKSEKPLGTAERILQILDKVPADALRSWLIDQLKRNQELLADFELNLSNNNAETEEVRVNKLLSAAIQKAKGRRDYIRRDMDEPIIQAATILENRAEQLLANGNLTGHAMICTTLAKQFIDVLAYASDRNGNIAGFINKSIRKLLELSKNADQDIREILLRFSHDALQAAKYADWERDLRLAELAIHSMPPKEHQHWLSALLQKEDAPSWIIENRKQLYFTYLELTEGKEKARSFRNQHLQVIPFRKAAIRDALSEENFALAEAICRDGIKTPTTQGVSLLYFEQQLIEIYQHSGDMDLEASAIHAYILNYPFLPSRELLKRVQTISPRWKEIWTDIYQKFKGRIRFLDRSMAHMLALEQQDWNAIQQLAIGSEDIRFQIEGLKEMPEEHQATMEQMIFDALERRMAFANNRQLYLTIVKDAKILEKHGYAQRVYEMAGGWLTAYKQRHACMEEIRRAFPDAEER